LSGTTQVNQYQVKGKTYLDFAEARDSEWQWHQPGHMQVCTSLQTDNHTIIPLLSFVQAGCPSCCPTNSVKAAAADSVITMLLLMCRASSDPALYSTVAALLPPSSSQNAAAAALHGII